jgi:hypothetical protein
MLTMPLNLPLADVRRVAWPTAQSAKVTPAEVALLVGAGVASAILSLMLDRWGIPGSTILQAILPMAAGLALVPRRGSGAVMAATALATGLVLLGIGTLHITPSALSRLFLLGLCLEIGVARVEKQRGVVLWFILAGLLTNLLGFGVKALGAQVGLEGLGASRGMFSTFPLRLTSWVLCGAVAGAIAGLVFFRAKSDQRAQQG